MKMIKQIMAFIFVFAFVLSVQVFGQGDCDPDKIYPEKMSTSKSCGNFDDCNNNGVYDESEPCHEVGSKANVDTKGDHPTGDTKGDHPTGGEESCPPKNDFHANCGAICAGMTEYWVDRDGDCEAEDGPFATWSEPTCPACPDDDDH